MKDILFSLHGNELLANEINKIITVETGLISIRQFPDKETYIRIDSDVKGKRVIIVCTLNNPDEKLLPLFFLAKTAKDIGATSVCLIAPYLSYMRQDTRFKAGEGITSVYFASWISSFVDELITIDPHLHRRNSLSEIYSVPTKVIQAAPYISKWIKENVTNPIIIGPDSESEQWVAEVATKAGAPHLVLNKVRHGDRHVEVSLPDINKLKNYTPVLVDDIVSTARTMIEAVKHIHAQAGIASVCICTHAIFADTAYNELLNAGVDKIVSCNTIFHSSNGINLAETIAKEIKN